MTTSLLMPRLSPVHRPPRTSPVCEQRQFVFGDFVLRSHALCRKGEEIALPPKERAVLVQLLESGGEILSKETLMERVWGYEVVGEESLTRCVSALRRLLREPSGQRLIQSVYGRGYRFVPAVTVVYPEAALPPQLTLAVLPFRLDGWDYDARAAHDAIIQSLHHFAAFGLSVLPAALTQGCQTSAETVALVKAMAPDYYLTGCPVIVHGVRALRLELVRGADHGVVHRENVAMTDAGWLLTVQHGLSRTLPACLPSLKWGGGVPKRTSLDVALEFLSGMRELRRCDIASLKRAAVLFRSCLARDAGHTPSWCALAETFLSMAIFGGMARDAALAELGSAVERALDIEPDNLEALALLALATSLRGGAGSAALLRQAAALGRGAAQLQYCLALHCAASGELQAAARALALCRERDPARVDALLLARWLSAACGVGAAPTPEILQLYLDENPLLAQLNDALATAGPAARFFAL